MQIRRRAQRKEMNWVVHRGVIFLQTVGSAVITPCYEIIKQEISVNVGLGQNTRRYQTVTEKEIHMNIVTVGK